MPSLGSHLQDWQFVTGSSRVLEPLDAQFSVEFDSGSSPKPGRAFTGQLSRPRNTGRDLLLDMLFMYVYMCFLQFFPGFTL